MARTQLAIRPTRLQAGDRVMLVSPSAAVANLFPRRLARGVEALEKAGFEVLIADNATAAAVDGLSASVQMRVDDLHQAFSDVSVSGIITTIGGGGATQLLDQLDYDLIASNPKVFCGYSDTTALHSAIRTEANLVTFYGPSVLAEWAEFPVPFAGTVDSFVRATGSSSLVGTLPQFAEVVSESPDWSMDAERRGDPAPRPVWSGSGPVDGRLEGGCLPVLSTMLGTPWAPITKGSILLLESPPGLSLIDFSGSLWQLKNAGAFDGVLGVAFGWPNPLSDFNKLVEYMRGFFGPLDIPFYAGLPFGHTSPRLTVPLGVFARLSAEGISVMETATTSAAV